MKRLIALCCAVALVGCAGEEAASDAADEDMAPGIALADIAGTWSLSAMPADGDSVLTTYEMTATGSREGWTFTFPDRDPIPITVNLVDGDSVVTVAGPFESVLRAGVMVTVRSVARLHGEMMMGTFTARYASGPDSVLSGRFEGNRAMQ